MENEKLIIGMPAGSLADPQRGGNLISFLRAAGFPTKGYDKGGPTRFPLHDMMVGWDGRPQEFASQLALAELDIAIGGEDWMRERMLEFKYEYGREFTLEKVLSLARGGVRIVIIHRPIDGGGGFDAWFKALLEAQPLVTMVSEMPYLAIEWFQNKARQLGFAGSHDGFSVQKFHTPPKLERGLVVYETWGKTEAKVLNGAVDFGMEITQTGSAIRNYGLEIADEVLKSETGVYINPGIRGNAAKYELARMFLLNLYGSVYAENKVLVLFNVRRECVDTVLDYLRGNKLFADEPTMNEGVNFTEFSVQLNLDDAALPIARVRYELAKLGATGIETVPLESCIPSIDSVNF